MSSLLRAWYLFLALAFVTFFFIAFVGQLPYALSSAIAAPGQLFFRVGATLRGTAVSLVDRRNLRRDNALLQARLAQAESDKRQLELQLERLEELLVVRDQYSSAARLVAPVYGVSPSPVIRSVTLGRGSAGGVVANMPAMTPAGLVGIVTDVSAGRATVRAITDPDSAVGVSVRGRGGQGVAVGIPGGLVRVINFDQEVPVEVGDIVETSSRGGLFPQGVTVGTVIEVPPRNPNSLRVEFLVRPAVDIGMLTSVVLLEPL